MSQNTCVGQLRRCALAVFASLVLPASLVCPLAGCGESTPTLPPPPADAGVKEGDALPILKNSSAAAKSKTTDEDTSHSLRSKSRKKD